MSDVSAMPGSRRDAVLLGMLLLGALAHLAIYHPALPERVASHFDGAGRADGWMSRDAFVVVAAVSYLSTGGLFLLIGRFLPSIPVSMINVPNREHWLAPERRAASLEDITRRMLRFGAATMVLLIGVFHQTFQANIEPSQTLRGAWVLLAAYSIYTVIWCVGLIRRFRRPPPDRLS